MYVGISEHVQTRYIQRRNREIETDVSQGSMLGPLLFIIYMNDVHKASANLKFILYADDTTITALCVHLLVVVTTSA